MSATRRDRSNQTLSKCAFLRTYVCGLAITSHCSRLHNTHCRPRVSCRSRFKIFFPELIFTYQRSVLPDNAAGYSSRSFWDLNLVAMHRTKDSGTHGIQSWMSRRRVRCRRIGDLLLFVEGDVILYVQGYRANRKLSGAGTVLASLLIPHERLLTLVP